MEYTQQIQYLKEQADLHKERPEAVPFLEQAINLADAHQDQKESFDLRIELIQAIHFYPKPELIFAYFPWLLARCDEDPEKFDSRTVLWYYKWVLEAMPDYLVLSKEQIMGAMDDFERRAREGNYNPKTIYEFRRILAMKLGDSETARIAQAEFEAAPDPTFLDRMLGIANCDACVLNNSVEYEVFLGNDEKAIRMAGPILKGQKTCHSVPHDTYPSLLLPMKRQKREFEAIGFLEKGYKLIKDRPADFIRQAECMRFTALSGDPREGISMFEKHLPNVFQTLQMMGVMKFYQASAVLFSALAQKGTTSLRLIIPGNAPFFREDNVYSCETLAAWFREQASGLASRFDVRNGNDYYTTHLESLYA